jgi:hypothetical protein
MVRTRAFVPLQQMAFVLVPLLACGLVAGLASANAESARHFPNRARPAIYEERCASCHGVNGKGDGPVAAALTVPPPDLTTIARRTGGAFPADRVAQMITYGGNVLAHGRCQRSSGWRASDGIIRATVDSLMRLIGALDATGIELIAEGAVSQAGGRGVRLKPPRADGRPYRRNPSRADRQSASVKARAGPTPCSRRLTAAATRASGGKIKRERAVTRRPMRTQEKSSR